MWRLDPSGTGAWTYAGNARRALDLRDGAGQYGPGDCTSVYGQNSDQFRVLVIPAAIARGSNSRRSDSGIAIGQIRESDRAGRACPGKVQTAKATG